MLHDSALYKSIIDIDIDKGPLNGRCCVSCFISGSTTMRPLCNQLYNIYYSSHPSAMRIEPLLHPSFKHIIPVMIPRYEKYPYGDSAPLYASMPV